MASNGTTKRMTDHLDDELDSSEGNLQAAKRELIKVGLEQGSLTRTQIEEMVPTQYMSKVELETLLFTFHTMNIRVIDDTDVA